MATWAPLFCLVNEPSMTAIKDSVVDFGYIQPGSFSPELSFRLWNNPVLNDSEWKDISGTGYDLSKESVKAINVSFPDALNVMVTATNPDGSESTKITNEPYWLYIATYNIADSVFNDYVPLSAPVKLADVLKGTHYDPFDKLNQKSLKSVPFKLKFYVPPEATQNETNQFKLSFTCTAGPTDPAGPGATNYDSI